jgi:Diadenosine tetraphosphate (Ap4A) hydrolase and other HIT family hydrolases
MTEEKCVFCSIANKQMPAKVLYEDEGITAVLDINPAGKGHTLVIPKQHYGSVYEMPQNQFLQFMAVADAIGYSIMLAQAPNNVDMLYTKELVKGNVTPHALIHLIPRYDDDSVSYAWAHQNVSEEEMTAIADSITATIEKVKANDQSAAQKESRREEPKKKPEEPPKEEEKPREISKKTVVF